MYKPNESRWWGKNMPNIIYNGNDPALLALSTLEVLNVDGDFLYNLKGAYSSCRKKEIPYKEGLFENIDATYGDYSYSGGLSGGTSS